MKKLISLLLVCMMLLSVCFTSTVFADDSIKIQINGIEQAYDQMPVIINGRTLVPMRAIFEALGAKVEWIDATKTVVGSRDRKYVKLKIDSDTVYVNGIEQKIDVPAKVLSGRTMVPVRFISEILGEKVEWDGTTKTVSITSDYLTKVAVSDKLAYLPSTLHRDIPKEFTHTNSWDDVIYYEESSVPSADITNQIMGGTDILSADDFIKNASFSSDNKVTETEYGKLEEITVEGQSFTKALRITTHTVPEKTNLHLLDYGKIGAGKVKKGDNLLFTCKVRLVDGGMGGYGSIWPSFQEVVKFEKSIWKRLYVSKDWQTLYVNGVAGENHEHLQIRFGYCDAPQTVEIADVRLINYGPFVSGDNQLPNYDGKSLDSFEKGALWRDEAIERIKKVRMGDFKVVVKDKEGNVIPDADVNFDMFESAIPLGSCINSVVEKNKRDKELFSKYFNGGVIEHNMKWGPYEEDNGKAARTLVNIARDLGTIYLRGHVMIMDYPKTPSGTRLLPDDLVENFDNKDYADLRIKEWIYNVSDAFAGEIFEWDVVNEALVPYMEPNQRSVYNCQGAEYYGNIYKWAKEVNPGAGLFVTEGSRAMTHYQLFTDILNKMYANENHFDSIGLQSHLSTTWRTPEELMTMYDELHTKYNSKIALTECTFNTGNEIFDANFVRDFFISALSKDYITGFCLWNFQRKVKNTAFMLDENYELTKAGEQFLDIFYNKMWTRNAKAKTDANGEGAIRGYYGNYDVTVTHNGITKTVMAAFHPGYENVLEITIG